MSNTLFLPSVILSVVTFHLGVTATEPDVGYQRPSASKWMRASHMIDVGRVTRFHTQLHAAACKHTRTRTFLYTCVSCMCQGCSRVYLPPPYHSMKWVPWFVEGGGAFVWQILVNIMDPYIRKSLKYGVMRAWEGDRRNVGSVTDIRAGRGEEEEHHLKHFSVWAATC